MNAGAAGTGTNHYLGETVDETDVTARLAEALAGLTGPAYVPPVLRPRIAAALLPVVREIADQQAAEELEAAADASGGERALRARAAALRGEAGR